MHKNFVHLEFHHFQIQNSHLKNLLNVTAPPRSKTVTARITLDPSSYISQKIFLNVGVDQNIKINSPVFNERGLIGRIIDIKENTSEVLLITDPMSKLPVFSNISNERFFVVGTLDGLEISHLENKNSLLDGEMILTTSSSGYFKKGIIVGKVSIINKKQYIIPVAKKNNSVLVKVLVYDFEKKSPNFD